MEKDVQVVVEIAVRFYIVLEPHQKQHPYFSHPQFPQPHSAYPQSERLSSHVHSKQNLTLVV